jgi:hypothetical protein
MGFPIPFESETDALLAMTEDLITQLRKAQDGSR